MPASTFPTKSAPTSAPFVKIPPPSLAKIEIKEAPKPNATKAFTISLSSTPNDNSNIIINSYDRRAKPATNIPVTAPDLKAIDRP